MAKDLKPGDKVSWDTSQGKTHGVVEKKQTCGSAPRIDPSRLPTVPPYIGVQIPDISGKSKSESSTAEENPATWRRNILPPRGSGTDAG